MHVICPPKFCITFVFHVSFTAVPKEIENNAYAKFGGQIRYIMGYIQVAYAINNL